MSQSNGREPSQDASDSSEIERLKSTLDGIADIYVCPITLELPLNPTKAADGKTYERSAIEVVIERAANGNGPLRSPATNQPMGPELVPDYQARETIEKLVRSGAIGGDKARRWKERVKDETYIASVREKAEGGDAHSMYRLGWHYDQGEHGLKEDDAKAFMWYKKASDKNYPPAMAGAGYGLVNGCGIEKNETGGMFLMTMAVIYDGGSAYAAYWLGMWHSRGDHGVPVDKDRAKFFLRMVADGACKHDDLGDLLVEHAKRHFAKLENNDR